MCKTCGDDHQMLWCRFACGCFGLVSEVVANDHVCGYGGSAVCPHCQATVNTLDDVRSGGHMWEEDAINHPAFAHHKKTDWDNLSTLCQHYREAGFDLLKLAMLNESYRKDYLQLKEWSVKMRNGELQRFSAHLDESGDRDFYDLYFPGWNDKKKKHAPSQKARKIKAKRAAAMHEE